MFKTKGSNATNKTFSFGGKFGKFAKFKKKGLEEPVEKLLNIEMVGEGKIGVSF